MTCYDLYTSPNNIRSTHRKKRSVFFNEGNLMERDNLEDLGRDGRIILQRVLKKLGAMAFKEGLLSLESLVRHAEVSLTQSL